MPRRDLTFRVFVSSTFSDLVAERNALQERVFPRLRDYCRSRGARFQAVDLRWGVSQEAALDQQTMNICLQELRRCQQLSPRPNFIVLLGDRYGWQPLPPQIDAGEFELLLNSLPDEADRRRLLRWYRRDDNALPAQYCLLPRSEPFTDGEGWSVEEAALLAILSRAVEQAIPAGDPRRRKYEESATHQEIRAGVLDAEDAAGHVFCYFRQIEDLPRGHEARGFRDLTRADAPDRQAAGRLRDLKTELETRLPPGHVYKYEAQWSGQAPQSDLDALCERVERNLRNVIDAELEAYEEVPELQREIDAHREFATARRRHFIGRQAVLGTIRDYLAGDRRGPLVIHGCSGSGKTALLAQAWAEHADQAGDAAIVGRFLGATPAASDLYSLLTSLCRQISQTYGDDTPIEGDVHELARSLPERFAVATPQRPLVLFLDAVDQLSPTDGAHTFSWLPRELPAHVKLVVSVLQVEGPAGASYESARRLLPADALVELGGLPPGEGEQLLDAWLADAHRTLQLEQKQHILARFAGCPLPLYLKLAFEEARRWKSDDGLPTGSDDVSGLSGDIPGILHDLFRRLERPEHHGAALVQSALASLAAGRAGLVEDELLDVLSADEPVIADFKRRSPHSPDVDHLPAVVWSRLYADLEPYLTTRRSDEARVLSFYHRQLIEAVESRYLQGENRQRAHGRLARYFAGRTRFADQPHEFTDPAGGRQPNRRKVSELPYQQTRAELWDDLSATLTDLPFLEAKCTAGLVYDLVADYRGAGIAPLSQETDLRMSCDVAEAAAFVRSHVHVLDQRPDLTLQLAANWRRDSTVRRVARATLADTAQVWLRNLAVDPFHSSLMATSDHRARGFESSHLSPDGTFFVLTHAQQPMMSVWNVADGQHIHDMYCSPDARPLLSCAISQDNHFLAGASVSGEVAWQMGSHSPCWATTDRDPFDEGAATWTFLSPCGRFLVSAYTAWRGTGVKGRLRVRDVKDGRLLAQQALQVVRAVAIAPDGHSVVALEERWPPRIRRRTLRVRRWSVPSLAEDVAACRTFSIPYRINQELRAVASLVGGASTAVVAHNYGVALLNFSDSTAIEWQARMWAPCSIGSSPDGYTIAIGDAEGSVAFFDIHNGLQSPKATVRAHSAPIGLCSFLPGGKHIVTACESESVLRFHEAPRGCSRYVNHGGAVLDAAFSGPARKQFATICASDRTVHFWDSGTGEPAGSLSEIAGASCTYGNREASLIIGESHCERNRERVISRRHQMQLYDVDRRTMLGKLKCGLSIQWRRLCYVVRAAAAICGLAFVIFGSVGLVTGSLAVAFGAHESIADRDPLGAFELSERLGNKTGIRMSDRLKVVCYFTILAGGGMAFYVMFTFWLLLHEYRGFTRCKVSPDGTLVVAGDTEGCVWAWELQPRRLLWVRWMGEKVRASRWPSELAKRLGTNWYSANWRRIGIVSLAFAPDGSAILVGMRGGVARVLDGDTGKFRGFPAVDVGEAGVCDLAPCGTRIVMEADGALVVINLDGDILSRYREHCGRIYRCEFSPSGKLAASCSADGMLAIWSTRDGTRVAQWLSEQEITALSWGDNDSVLIAGDNLGGVAILKVEGPLHSTVSE